MKDELNEFIQKQKDTIVFDKTRALNFIRHAYEYRNTEKDEEVLKKKKMNGPKAVTSLKMKKERNNGRTNTKSGTG